ncbi:FIVAR domain-containing protein [Bifidobacterium aerophilum]|uniref:Peptidase n=1 Tax=Bifidobacterium aerophilum TaxID=1798155 RepID=A0A6N9Z2U9_9BIFI|nr:FIVAR domain-containing protein [Bifidobacterium aerophilum]NEG88821.1 hypothetical protein [Bifidobacterium aerophilum]
MGRVKKIAAALIAACTLFGGAGAAYAGESGTPSDAAAPQTAAETGNLVYGKTSVSNVRVSDVGAHTANVTFDYTIDQSLLPQIEKVCFAVDLQRIAEVTATSEPDPGYAWGRGSFDVACTGVKDEDLTQSTYNSIYGIRANQPVVDVSGNTVGSASYQSFTRFYDSSWDGKATGTFDLTVIGLTAGMSYGNRNVDQFSAAPLIVNLWRMADKAYQEGGHVADVDFSQVYAGLRIDLKNGDHVPFDDNSTKVPDFTTTAEPASTPTAPDLTESNKGDLAVADGTVTAGSVARIYVNNLAKGCAAKVDAGENCFWYSYIYSDPVKLTGPDGAPYVTIAKDDAGRYYFDAYIPVGYSGAHKISLQDADGNIQGWTDMTVGEKTPSSVDKTALNAAIAAAGKLNKSDYTEATWNAFAKALDSANAVAAKQDATQDEVDAATKALTDAQSGLRKAAATPTTPVTPAPDDQSKKDEQPKADKGKAQAKPAAKELSQTGSAVTAVAAVMLVMVAAAGVVTAICRRA